MNQIEKLIEELCPNGVEYKPLGEVGTFSRGGGLQKKDFTESGVGCIHYGQIYTHYGIWATETKSFVSDDFAAKKRKMLPGDVFIATTSENDEDLGKATAWLGTEEIVISGDGYVFRHSMNPKFVSYFFNSSLFHRSIERWITGTKVRRISSAAMSKVMAPCPPLEIQQEIVKILDTFQSLEAELEAELEVRKKQYEFYRDQLLTFTESESVRWATLGEVSQRVSSGATPAKSNRGFYQGGKIPWLRTQEVVFNEIYSTNEFITEQAVAQTGAHWIPENCLIVAISGASAGRCAVNKIPLTTNQHCCNIELDETAVNFKFAFYWTAAHYEELKALGRGARSDLNSKIIKNFPIPIPPLEEQQRIVNILDKFDALVNDLASGLPAEIKARRKQYEYYRDQLLKFKKLLA
ncbi:restriction endonuclease subunit S [uncultured Corynebacterium sp.]|uniref:restriction endonuclease subunit S n=1 Tax=uncultured Corynebacterium sp. TaxID=159447 RepID=UPI00261124D9|nr:restriction endonuclease subunit S [uncultured Corynebacterium sp.]